MLLTQGFTLGYHSTPLWGYWFHGTCFQGVAPARGGPWRMPSGPLGLMRLGVMSPQAVSAMILPNISPKNFLHSGQNV